MGRPGQSHQLSGKTRARVPTLDLGFCIEAVISRADRSE